MILLRSVVILARNSAGLTLLPIVWWGCVFTIVFICKIRTWCVGIYIQWVIEYVLSALSDFKVRFRNRIKIRIRNLITETVVPKLTLVFSLSVVALCNRSHC